MFHRKKNARKLISGSFIFDPYLDMNSDNYAPDYKNMSLDEMYNELDSAISHNTLKLAKNMYEFGAITKFMNLAEEIKDNINDDKYYHQNMSNISKMYALITPSIPKAIASAALIFIGVALILASVTAAVLSGGFSTPFSIAGFALGLTVLKAASLVMTTVGLASLIGGGILANQAKTPITTPHIKERAEHIADKAYENCKKIKIS